MAFIGPASRPLENMRSLWPFLVVALAALTFAATAAAASTAWEDASGDQEFEVLFGESVPVANAQTASADLVGFDLEEDLEGLTFTLTVDSFAHKYASDNYWINWTWNNTDYELRLGRLVYEGVISESVDARFIRDSDDDFDAWEVPDVRFEPDAGVIGARIPRAYLADVQGRLPAERELLDAMLVESSSTMTLFAFGAQAHDRLPDADFIAYPLVFGDTAQGDLKLRADDRVRVSNGGATTFVYSLEVVNRGEQARDVELELADLPAGWEGSVSSPLRVDADDDKRVTILMTVPFEHDHGGFSTFEVQALAKGDANSRATMRLGVLHTPIAQPAGHHSELFLHGRQQAGLAADQFTDVDAWMNTAADHAGDVDRVPFDRMRNDAWSVAIPLGPALRMGLDFDIKTAGSLVGAVVSPTAGDGTVRADLWLWSDEAEVLLAEGSSVPISLSANTPTTFETSLTPTLEADYVPYTKDADLVLVVAVGQESPTGGFFCCSQQTSPALTTQDFLLTLPLNEYHDRIVKPAGGAASLALDAVGAVEKLALPGSTMTYTFDLTNHGPAGVFVVSVAGADAEAAAVTPAGDVSLAEGETRTLTLAVQVPADAVEDDVLEALVFSHARDDPSQAAVGRTLTGVTRSGSAAAADESAVFAAAQAQQDETPALGVVGGLVALVAAAVVFGRRQRRG